MFYLYHLSPPQMKKYFKKYVLNKFANYTVVIGHCDTHDSM